MILLFSAFGLVLGLGATFSFAQDEKAAKHPIDVKLETCLKISHGTMPRAKCYSDASEACAKINVDPKTIKEYDTFAKKE